MTDPTPPTSRIEVFDLAGDAALAWYFVMANWSDAGHKPSLQLRPGSQVIFAATPASIVELHRVLGRALEGQDSLAQSAQSLSALLTRRGLDPA